MFEDIFSITITFTIFSRKTFIFEALLCFGAIRMRKIQVEISEAHYCMLKEIAEKFDLSVKDLVQQEVDEVLANIEVWYERLLQ